MSQTTQQLFGGFYFTPQSTVDESSLNIINLSLMNTVGAQIASWCPNIISVVLCFTSNTSTDFDRMRQVIRGEPRFPSLCINREPQIQFNLAYRPTQNKYTADVLGRQVKFSPVVLNYSMRLYSPSYKLCERIVETLILNKVQQFQFVYNIPWLSGSNIQVNEVEYFNGNIAGNYNYSIPIISESPPFDTQQVLGPIFKVQMDIQVNAMLVDPPDIYPTRPIAAIVYTSIVNFYQLGSNGEPLTDTLTKMIVPPGGDVEFIGPPAIPYINPLARLVEERGFEIYDDQGQQITFF